MGDTKSADAATATVSVKTERGITYVFDVCGARVKLAKVVVDYAWCETSLSAEARAKYVHEYAPDACPVVKVGLVAARAAALAKVST